MQREELYNSKFLYYKKYIYYLVIIICFSSFAYYISDCMLYERFQITTLFPRIMVIIPTIAFVVAFHKSTNRFLISTLAYLVFHTVVLGTIGACLTLPNLEFASDGFIILQYMFVAIGLAMPRKYTTIWQGLTFLEIAIAHPFVHYPDFVMMYILGFPIYIGNIALTVAMDHTFEDQHANKLALEFANSHDPLTKCFNRNLFMDESLGLLKDFNENYRSYSFLLFDLDDFKKINDTYGHTEGDEILKLVVTKVNETLSSKDFLVRWGGEEFLVISKCPPIQALDLAHNMNKAVNTIEYKGSHISISIGISSCESEHYLDAIKCADEAMYKAKEAGKNTACIF